MKRLIVLIILIGLPCFLVVSGSSATTQISIGPAAVFKTYASTQAADQFRQLANIADPTEQVAIQAVIIKNSFIGGDISAGIVAIVRNGEALGYHPKTEC